MDADEWPVSTARMISATKIAHNQFFDVCFFNGKVYKAPYDASALTIYDCAANTFADVDVSSLGTGAGKWASVCAFDGRIYAAPCNARNLLVYDPTVGNASGVDICERADVEPSQPYKFMGICGLNGKLYLAPRTAECLLVYDISEDKLTNVDISHIAKGGNKFAGACACDGKIFCAPCDSNMMLMFDPVAGIPCGIDLEGIATGNWKFWGICASETEVYAAPCHSENLLVYNMKSHKVKGLSVDKKQWKYQGIGMLGDKVYAAPLEASNILVYDPATSEVSVLSLSELTADMMMADAKFQNKGRSDMGGVCGDEGAGVLYTGLRDCQGFFAYKALASSTVVATMDIMDRQGDLLTLSVQSLDGSEFGPWEVDSKNTTVGDIQKRVAEAMSDQLLSSRLSLVTKDGQVLSQSHMLLCDAIEVQLLQ